MPHDFKTACEEPFQRFAEGPEGLQGSDPAANSDFVTLSESGSIKISNIKERNFKATSSVTKENGTNFIVDKYRTS